MGTAGLVEICHTLSSLSLSWHLDNIASFSPLFFQDHVAAFTGWLLFYLLDVAAIKAVLDAHQGDDLGASKALDRLVTLPQRLIPVPLAKYMLFSRMLATPDVDTAVAVQGVAQGEALTHTQEQAQTQAFVVADDPTTTITNNIVPTTTTATTPPPTMTRRQRPKQQKQNNNTLLAPGQMDPSAIATFDAFARRRKELADRKAYLHGFWYAAALSSSLPHGKPVGVDILSTRIVLFRDSTTGVVRALDDVCPHRGAPFSGGWIHEHDGHDCVVCPYHGWAVDGDGRLRDVPAAEHKGEWPHRQMVAVHHVEEKGGFIWLWYGPKDLPRDARPPIPHVPELDNPEWKAVYGEIEFDCGHFGVFENAIDMAHIHYLHSDSFGNQSKPEIREMTCTTSAHTVTAEFKLHNKPASALWEWTKVPEVTVTAKAFLPSTSMITFTLGQGLSFTTVVNTVPVSTTKTVNRFALVRNLSWDSTGTFNADVWDSWARKAMLRILGEDKVMVERLRPDLLQREFSVRADLPQVEFRKLRQQWIDLGWVKRSEPAVWEGGLDATGRVQYNGTATNSTDL